LGWWCWWLQAGAVPKKMSAEDAALMAEAAAAQQGDGDDDMDMEEEEEVQMKIVRNYKRPDLAGAGAANAAEAAGCVPPTPFPLLI